MGYLDQNLLPGEKVIYRATPHWVLFVSPTLIFFAALFLILFSIVSDVGYGLIISLVCLFVGLLGGLSSAVTYFTTEFGLTNKRVIAKEGLIRRRSVELLLTQVESIGVYQPILGRILNYGTITVVGTGGTKEPFRAIPDPLELRKRVHMQISDPNGLA